MRAPKGHAWNHPAWATCPDCATAPPTPVPTPTLEPSVRCGVCGTPIRYWAMGSVGGDDPDHPTHTDAELAPLRRRLTETAIVPTAVAIAFLLQDGGVI